MILFVLLREFFSDVGYFHTQLWLPLELQWEYLSSGKDEFIWSLLGQLSELWHTSVHFSQMTIRGSWARAQMKTSMLQGEVKPDRQIPSWDPSVGDGFQPDLNLKNLKHTTKKNKNILDHKNTTETSLVSSGSTLCTARAQIRLCKERQKQ